MEKTVVKSKKRAPLTLWGRVGIILGAAVVIGLALTLILFFGNPDPTYISAELQLTFDGAAEGKAPDGYAFSVDDLTSDAVIRAALEAASLSDEYTPEQIRSGLVITGNYPEDIVKQTMSYDSLLNFTANRTLTVDRYHPTLFRVTLYNYFDSHISRAKLENLLRSLLSAYQSQFAVEYAQGAMAVGEDDSFELSNYDYPQQLQILQQRLAAVSAYAQEMYEREPSFRYGGSSFNDIVARISNLQDSDIGRLNANMTLNALTKDPDRLETQYEFAMRDLNDRLTRHLEQLTNMDALIDSYEKSEIIYISTSDSLTKIDGNSSETYDALIDLRREIAEDNTMTSSQIATYRLKLADLNGEDEPAPDSEAVPVISEAAEVGEETDAEPAGDGEETDVRASVNTVANESQRKLSEEAVASLRESFERDVAALEAKCDAVIADFSAMIKAWNESKINELTVTASEYRYFAPRLISGAFIKTAIKTAGPIVALAAIVCLCMIIAVKKREEMTN